jgi:hypothetical protein
MFSQFRNVVEGLAQAQPRLPPGAPRHENTNPATASLERGQSPSPAPPKPLTERSPFKVKLEDRLRASFTIGDVSNPSTPSASSRVSPAPQYEHPLSPDIDHPLSPTSIPLPISPPPHNHNFPLDALYSPSDPSSPPLLNDPNTVDHGTSATTTTSDLSNQHPLSDAPVIPQPAENEPTSSEEAIEMDDTTESIGTTDLSQSPVDTISDAQSVAGSNQADSHEPELVSEHGNISEPDHPASANMEALQEQLKLMEQRFVGKYRLLPSLNLFLNLNRRFCVVCEASGRKDGRR